MKSRRTFSFLLVHLLSSEMSLESSYKGHFPTNSVHTGIEPVIEDVSSYSIGGNVFPSRVHGSLSQSRFDGAECLDPESVEICVVCGDRASGKGRLGFLK